jgi:hypothetical protein
MGSYVQHGGYVITTLNKNYVSAKDLSQDTLKDIAKLLGISKADADKLGAESIRTIFAYAPEAPKKS